MTRRRHREDIEPPGQDSFMDVVANLVGIVLIVVMLVGLRTKDVLVERARQDAIVAAEDAPGEESVEPSPDPDAAKLAEAQALERSADDIEREMKELSRRIEIETRTADLRRAERTEAQLLLASAKMTLADRTQEVDEERRGTIGLVAKVRAASSTIDDLVKTRTLIESEAKRPVPLPHVPTPMAQTVFGREIHFRLKDDRLLYVPWDAMVDELKLDAEKNVWKLRESDRVTEAIGPFEGYRMEYTLVRTNHVKETAAGVATMQSIDLESFFVQPTHEPAGEPIEAALADGSEFSRRLAQVSPKAYTVTLWVYPDSFGRFREIREALMAKGFLTASRPMPPGQPIGGSPNGSRSVTQ